MTNARPNALGLAVAIAISASFISTQALAERRLQTKFAGIGNNKQTELFQSEAVVKPTLDDNQQPIPKSFTTTYPERAPDSAHFSFPTFIDIMSTNAAVSIVDLFETDENDAARKYTKILKVGDEGVFRFSHNLEQEELVIEVRAAMTDQDALEALRDETSMDILEPLSEIAKPSGIFDEVLKLARDRAGKLGASDDYIALATLDVDKIEVKGRTFMRLISGGDQPPELKQLGQSLFVNDEALLTAATSAYFQVHVLERDIQQQALNKLLAHSKPVGYVVHVEDDTQIYPVPEGYPKLEVTEAPGEVIVFRGQIQYTPDVAFIESLHDLWQKSLTVKPANTVKTKVVSYDTPSYRCVLRSRQMALLEESAAYYQQHKTEFKFDTLAKIVYYEYLYQALTSATLDGVYKFEFTIGHIRAAATVITPTWLQFQLERHFSFNPVIKNLLTNQRFVETLRSVTNTIISATSVNHFGDLEDEGQFTAKVISDMAEQLPEMYKRLEDLQIEEAKLLHIKNQLPQTTATEAAQQIEDELATLRARQEILENQEQQLQEESKRIPGLKEPFLNARNLYHSKRATRTEEPEPHLQQQEKLTDKAIWNKLANPDARQHHLKHLQKLEKRKKWLQELEQEIDRTLKLREEIHDPLGKTIEEYKDQLAKALNIEDWDETDYPIEQQTELIRKKIHEISRPGQPPNEAVKDILASIESKHDITPDNENDLAARFQSIQQHLKQKTALVEEYILNRLADFESQLDLLDNNDHLEHRQYALKQHLRKQIAQVEQEYFQQLGSRTEAEKIAATQDRFATIATHLNLKGFNSDADFETQQKLLLETIHAMMAEKDSLDQQVKTVTHKLDRENVKTAEQLSELAELKSELEDMRTPGHPKIMPEVLGKLRAVANALKAGGFDENDDVYLRRQVISSLMQTHIVEARQRAEEEALETLGVLERFFTVNTNGAYDKATRLRAVRAKLDYYGFSNYLLYDSDRKLWKDDSPATKDLQGKDRIRARLTYKVEESDQRAREKQTEYLLAIEHELNIEPQNPDVNKRKAAIDNELDRQVARLGPKPRFVLDREEAQARQALKEAESYLESDLGTTEKDFGLTPAPSDTTKERVIALIKKWPQMLAPGLTNGEPGYPLEKYTHWMKKITARLENIDRIKDDLETVEEAVKKDGGSFRYTPKQVQVLNEIHTFTQHPLKEQALQAAIGLIKTARENGKAAPVIIYTDFDDEWAPVHFHARMENTLTLEQTSRIVEVFRSLKTVPPDPSVFEEADPPIKTATHLAETALQYTNDGPEEYDKKILDMGSAFLEHQPRDLKSFSEYFETHSATGNKIITLLREGLISKVELEHYIKAVRGKNGYQIVAEFEYFLRDKHGIKVPKFKGALRDLPDKSAEAFMQSAFTPVTVTATGPAGMEESVAGMKEYAAAIIANYVLDDIAFENGRKTAAFLTHLQDTLTPYANAAGISESEFIMAIHNTLMQAHVAAFGRQLFDYWLKPSASLVQAVTWYYSNYRPLLATRNAQQATNQAFANMAHLYLLDLTNRGDYLHRMLTPFQHWLEHYGVDTDRTGQYAYHRAVEQIAEVGGLAMPLGKAASSAILLKTASELFTRQYNANPQMYRSIFRLVPEMLNSMDFGQGVQVPLLHRVTPRTVKTLASATAGLVLGPVVTVGAYAHGLISGFTYAQTFGFALTSSLAFDFFMNDNKLLTQWLAGPLGRSLDRINRWRGVGETDDDYVKRTAIASPQGFNETDEAYANRVKASNKMYGWTRHENYLQFRERRDRTMKLYEKGWEQYFKNNVPKWSFSHAESVPYTYTLGFLYQSQRGDDQTVHNKNNAPSIKLSTEL